MANRKNQKGFSLIELMMVVVIIGVLAGVGIPQYQKFQMKARQSEVKSLLSSMYTSQKAFYAEWNRYYADFNAVGYGLSGALGYRVGFANGAFPGPANHPSATYRNQAATVMNSSASGYCGSIDATTGMGANGCSDAPSKAVTDIGGTTASETSFSFGGQANLDDDATFDQWTLNENKQFNHASDDITTN